MPEEAAPASASRRETIKLPAWARWISGGLGFAGVTAGGAAVFLEDVEAGPVALIAFGSVFLLLSLLGFMPSSVKLGGGAGVDWTLEQQEATGDVLNQAIEAAPANERPQLVEAVSDADIPAAVKTPVLNAWAFELEILQGLADLVTKRVDLRIFRQESDHPYDAAIYTKNGWRIAVEIRFQRYPGLSRRSMIELVVGTINRETNHSKDFGAFLLITNSVPSNVYERIKAELGNSDKLFRLAEVLKDKRLDQVEHGLDQLVMELERRGPAPK